jgi:chromosomal replication initiator protein
METITHPIHYFAVAGIKINMRSLDLKFRKEKIEYIQTVVCNHYGISVEELFKKDRHPNIVAARYILMFVMKKRMGMSLVSIGKHFGKDHSTVIHAVKKVECILDPKYSYPEKADFDTILTSF